MSALGDDPAEFLRPLRDPRAPRRERMAAWGEFVRWFSREHPWARKRLARQLQTTGSSHLFGPEDVLSAFYLRVFHHPEVLGKRATPSRSWIWWRLQDVCRRLEVAAAEPERTRARSSETQDHLLRLVEGTADHEPSPEGLAMLRELREALERELVLLARDQPDQHRALLLKSERSYPEVAAAMNKSIGTVKSLVSRAREGLRARLSDLLRPSKGGSR